jgi:hypothetical protein
LERKTFVSILLLSPTMCKNIKKHESLCETWYSTTDSRLADTKTQCIINYQLWLCTNILSEKVPLVCENKTRKSAPCATPPTTTHLRSRPFNAFPNFLRACIFPSAEFSIFTCTHHSVFVPLVSRAKDYAQPLYMQLITRVHGYRGVGLEFENSHPRACIASIRARTRGSEQGNKPGSKNILTIWIKSRGQRIFEECGSC